jgi:hypothetical protein
MWEASVTPSSDKMGWLLASCRRIIDEARRRKCTNIRAKFKSSEN